MGQCDDVPNNAEVGADRATLLPWHAPEFGDMLTLMAQSYYPVDEDEGGKRVTRSVRLPEEVHSDIELIAKLWSEFDAARGKTRAKKWKSSGVIERLLEVSVAGFWQQVGGRPPTKEGREDFIRRALAQVRKSTGAR